MQADFSPLEYDAKKRLMRHDRFLAQNLIRIWISGSGEFSRATTSFRDMLQANLTKSQQLVSQTKQRKAKGPKLSSWHAPGKRVHGQGKDAHPI